MTDAAIIERDDALEPTLRDWWQLLKPRVMSLVVFTAAVGLLVAPVHVNPVIAFASILFIALGAGASGALNMWWDADIDAVMRRTARRRVPSTVSGAQDPCRTAEWFPGTVVGEAT